MFFAVTQNSSGTFAGVSLAGLGNIPPGGTIPARTRIKLQGTGEVTALLGTDLLSIPSQTLNKIVEIFRAGGYHIERSSTSGGEITIQAVTLVDKVSEAGIVQDFTNSCNAGLNDMTWDEYQAAWFTDYQVSNVHIDILDEGVTDTEDSTRDNSNDKSLWESLGLSGDFLDKSFEFLGGTITGATIATVAALFIGWRFIK